MQNFLIAGFSPVSFSFSANLSHSHCLLVQGRVVGLESSIVFVRMQAQKQYHRFRLLHVLALDVLFTQNLLYCSGVVARPTV